MAARIRDNYFTAQLERDGNTSTVRWKDQVSLVVEIFIANGSAGPEKVYM
jgi:hypothetical protein